MLDCIVFNEIVLKGDVAVKTYQTSAPGELVQLLDTDGLETVAPAKVPAVLEQPAPAAPGVKVIAPEQASFDGGVLGARCVIQILKLPVAAGGLVLSDPTLTRYVFPIVKPEAV